MRRILQQTWRRTWTTLATSSSVTPVLVSSIIQGVQRLQHCDVHAPGHGRAGGHLGHRPCLDTEPLPLRAVGGILVPCANRLYGPVLTLWMYHTHYESGILQSGCFFDQISRSTPKPAVDVS